MQTRKVGKNGLKVSALGLGGMGVSFGFNTVFDPRDPREGASAPGTTELSRLDENLGAVTIEFTADDLRAIDAAARQITIEGALSPEKLEALTGR
jgi:aryl-alcohol dehydrogenase-like predicted oxidoreductase